MADMIGPLIGAGGNLAGGIIASKGGLSNGDYVIPTYSPQLDAAFQASQFDLLNQIGFGNVSNTVSPMDTLLQRIGALPIDEKTKRRALTYLTNQLNGKDSDKNIGRFKQVLSRLGITKDEFDTVRAQSADFDRQQKELYDKLGPLNQETILNRANTANQAAQLLGAASEFATTGQPQNSLQNSLLNRVNRNINEQEDAYLMRAQFGGFSPGAGVQQFSDARLDAQLTALEQSLAASAGLSQALGIGANAGSTAGANSSQAGLSATQLAAQQAAAANQLRNNTSLDRATSLANGISSAGSTLGTGIANMDIGNKLGTILGGNGANVPAGNYQSSGGGIYDSNNFSAVSSGPAISSSGTSSNSGMLSGLLSSYFGG